MNGDGKLAKVRSKVSLAQVFSYLSHHVLNKINKWLDGPCHTAFGNTGVIMFPDYASETLLWKEATLLGEKSLQLTYTAITSI